LSISTALASPATKTVSAPCSSPNYAIASSQPTATPTAFGMDHPNADLVLDGAYSLLLK
jgi:hypothetical protein